MRPPIVCCTFGLREFFEEAPPHRQAHSERCATQKFSSASQQISEGCESAGCGSPDVKLATVCRGGREVFSGLDFAASAGERRALKWVNERPASRADVHSAVSSASRLISSGCASGGNLACSISGSSPRAFYDDQAQKQLVESPRLIQAIRPRVLIRSSVIGGSWLDLEKISSIAFTTRFRMTY